MIGGLYQTRSKDFLGDRYFVLMLQNKPYFSYEIGLGREGTKIPIYDEKQQIAIIEKGTVVYDNKDEYEIFVLDENSLEICLLFNLYYDIVRFGNKSELVYKSKEVTYVKTINKELSQKYNPDFKNQC